VAIRNKAAFTGRINPKAGASEIALEVIATAAREVAALSEKGK
jgi:hypothetical protein